MCSPGLSPLSWLRAWDRCSPAHRCLNLHVPLSASAGSGEQSTQSPHSPESPFPPQPQTLEHPANPSVAEFIPHKPQTSFCHCSGGCQDCTLPDLNHHPPEDPRKASALWPLPWRGQEQASGLVQNGGQALSPTDTAALRPRAGRVTAGLRPTPSPLSGPFGDTSGGRRWQTLHTLERTSTQSHTERASHPRFTASSPGWPWLGHLASEPASLFAHKSWTLQSCKVVVKIWVPGTGHLFQNYNSGAHC